MPLAIHSLEVEQDKYQTRWWSNGQGLVSNQK